MFSLDKYQMIERLLNCRNLVNYRGGLNYEENDIDCDLYRDYLESMSIEALEDEYIEITGDEIAA